MGGLHSFGPCNPRAVYHNNVYIRTWSNDKYPNHCPMHCNVIDAFKSVCLFKSEYLRVSNIMTIHKQYLCQCYIIILSSFCHLESGNIYNQLITAQGIIRQTIHREPHRSTKIDFGEKEEWKSISSYFLLFTLRMGAILKVTKPNWVLS